MRRLLAIDDVPDSAELVVRCAMKCGYDAMTMTTPAGVADVVAKWKPHVLTLDLCMPELDGIGFLTLLSEAGFSGDLVIISGQDEKVRRAAAKIAADKGMRVLAELPKPFDLAKLRALLSTATIAA
jgi:two-component system chemotaxis response regulator CheY